MIKNTWHFTTGRFGERARGHFSVRRLKFWVISKNWQKFEKKKLPPPSLSLLDISNQGSTHRTTQIQDVRVKLPKLDFSKFDGDIINWRGDGYWQIYVFKIIFFGFCFAINKRSFFECHYPLDTGRKLNVYKTFKRRPGRLLKVLCTFNLHPVSRG